MFIEKTIFLFLNGYQMKAEILQNLFMKNHFKKLWLLQQELTLSEPEFFLDVRPNGSFCSTIRSNICWYLLFGYLILDHKAPDNWDFSYHLAYNDILRMKE